MIFIKGALIFRQDVTKWRVAVTSITMKNLFPLFIACALVLWASTSFSQKQLRTLQATNVEANVFEGSHRDMQGWWLTPEARPDVYVTDKCQRKRDVVFRTDIDSIAFSMRPGEYVNFVVVLNGKDSCFTQVQCPDPIEYYENLATPTHDTIPFVLTPHFNLLFDMTINETDSIKLKFDSGATGLVITEDAMAERPWLFTGEGEERRLKPYHSMQLGSLAWDSLGIWPTRLSGQGSQGRFGWDFFDGRVVEIDFDNSWFIVHSKLEKRPKGYQKLKINYAQTLFCIEGNLRIGNKKYRDRFLFDNGYQRAVLLDTTLIGRNGFPVDLPVIKSTILRNGRGEEIKTEVVMLEGLGLGKLELENVPAQRIEVANPARFITHILGNETLMRFNTILDFQNDRVYLRPNSLWERGYTDAS